MTSKLPYIFFGTSEFSVIILQKLLLAGFSPSLIITSEDKPAGRGLKTTPSPVKIWAEKNKLPFLQPKANDPELISKLKATGSKLFIVASYGKIIPKEILEIPTRGSINIHPSLLPKLRGASPIQGAILNESETGVSIMLMDEKMDHGPILAQKNIQIPNWPPYAYELEKQLADESGNLLIETIPKWINNEISANPQDHERATFTKLIKKDDAKIDLNESPELNLRKIKAYSGNINAWTIMKIAGKDIRLIIKTAHIEDEKLVLDKIIPEGKKEMLFADWQRGLNK